MYNFTSFPFKPWGLSPLMVRRIFKSIPHASSFLNYYTFYSYLISLPSLSNLHSSLCAPILFHSSLIFYYLLFSYFHFLPSLFLKFFTLLISSILIYSTAFCRTQSIKEDQCSKGTANRTRFSPNKSTAVTACTT